MTYDINPKTRGKFFPTIVCLCGSTRFKKEFTQANFEETMRGNIVLTVGVFVHADHLVSHLSKKARFSLNALHLHKIEMADEILVLNVNGYIGKGTKREIDYRI